MHKNQLQELAQRSCFNLPCYTCIREGPDHAPRFKATVSFNGEVFESPGYHTTLRQAEHAAAEVALTVLSQRGPTQSLASRILDETGVCKNLLQETAQRAGFSLPVYNVIRTGPKHQPLYKCIVEIGGRHFKGEPATTKKQAEKNAATAAWTALNGSSSSCDMHLTLQRPESGERELSISSSMLNMGRRPSYQPSSFNAQFVGRPQMPVTVRDKSSVAKNQCTRAELFYPMVTVGASNTNRNNRFVFDQVPMISSSQLTPELEPRFTDSKQYLGKPSEPAAEACFDSLALGQRGALYHNQDFANSFSPRQRRRHQRRHSLSGMESPALLNEAVATSRASAGGAMLGRGTLHSQQQRIRGLPYQSLSERFELKRSSLLEELQPREEDDDWFNPEKTSSLSQRQVIASSSVHSQGNRLVQMPSKCGSERFKGEMHELLLHAEAQCRDHQEVWRSCDSQDAATRCGEGKGLDFQYGPRDLSILNGDLHSNIQRDGWIRGDMVKQSSHADREHGCMAGWCTAVGSQQCLEGRHPSSKQEYGSSSKYVEGWSDKEWACGAPEHGWVSCRDKIPSKALQGEKNVHIASSTLATSSASPRSSLWSKSTQWWGSHMSSSISSASASMASTLGLRPLRSAAPEVKVRQMVPVCSAPPRSIDTPNWRHQPQNDKAGEISESCKAMNNLRI